jgi:ABC-type Mn2+/Zn2+ transport system ATPase subunit
MGKLCKIRLNLALVYGPTGAGKSSLLSAILGEMHAVKGGVAILGDNNTSNVNKNTVAIGYASQQGIQYI